MRRLASLPREIVYFAGIGLYGLVIGIVYWFLTYEAAGTILLTVFGGACFGLAVLLSLTLRRRPGRPVDVEDNPFTSESGRVPAGTFAPLEVGAGIALISLSLAFGVWTAIAGIVPFVAGVFAWLRSAEREHLATERDDVADAAAPRGGRADRVSPGRRAAEPPSG